MITDRRAFIQANTKLMSPPLVPEIKLHLAEESLPIWLKTEEELDQINVPPPFWAFAWAGGQALARYILDNPTLVAGNTILDLGCGSGLTAIAPMLAGAKSALAADIDMLALASVEVNAEANGVLVSVTSENLLAFPPKLFDVTLVGDLFYERAMSDHVLGYVQAAAALGSLVLIGDPQRTYFPRGRFTQVAEYNVPVTRELEDSEIKRTAVWRLQI
jgi:predicted nicotinamide N-methyase